VSIRQQLVQTARLAPRFLADSTGLVRAFYERSFSFSGAALNRAGLPDLYYTAFALAGAAALESSPHLDSLSKWLTSFEDGAELDFVHRGALARCWAAIGRDRMPRGLQPRLLKRLEEFRKPDGGYDGDRHRAHGTAYGAFVALGAYEDLCALPRNLIDLARGLAGLRSSDGAWSNAPGQAVGALNATAGATVLLRQLGLPVPAEVGRWILAQEHSGGGFLAVPGAPIPDLLSTATALQALAAAEIDLPEEVNERCFDFIDSLWSAEGGFHGNWADDILDVEYTFYGLLALGNLARQSPGIENGASLL
jgi:hypothetical protein